MPLQTAMLRITNEAGNQAGRHIHVLRLEGQVTGPWVDELRTACEAILGSNGHGPQLLIDLAGVSFLDAGAIVLFRELAEKHVRIRRGSPFTTEQLKGVADVE